MSDARSGSMPGSGSLRIPRRTVFPVFSQARIAEGGWMGVDVFFVLSGYLITDLLLRERGSVGRISLGQFYVRRLLRLYPALLLALAVGTVFYKTLGDHGTLSGYGKTAVFSGLYLQDFATGLTGHTFTGFAHTWSLAVEEQFYLVWPPVLVLLIARRRSALLWAIGGTVLSWAAMIISLRPDPFGVPQQSYYLPWNRISQLLIGCALALALARYAAPRLVGRTTFGWLVAVGTVGLVLITAHAPRYPNMSWEAPAIAIMATVLICHLTVAADGSVRRSLGLAPLAWLGRRSYGIYLYHLPILLILDDHRHTSSRRMVTAAMFGVTLVVATLSYQFVERPFLKLKARFTPPETPITPETPTSASAVLAPRDPTFRGPRHRAA